MTADFWKVDQDDLILRGRVTPNASRDGIGRVEPDADGRPCLRIRVGAPPEKGRVNKSVIILLAGMLGIAKSSIEVVKGETDRVKTLHITGGAHLVDLLCSEFGG